MRLNLDTGRLTTHRRGLALRAGLGLVMALFVVGSFYSGWFFLSQAASHLVATAHPISGQGSEKRAGADTASVLDGNPEAAVGVPGKEASDPRYAFLLLGYGGGGHDGAYLTDSIMAVIVDPTQKTLTMLSIPRDAWVPLIFNGQTAVYNKVNTGYAFARDTSLYTDRLPRYRGNQGAGSFATDTVARLLGIPISYYVALDFTGFRQMIDIVGGIDVNVPDGFSANYPANDDPEIDPSWIVVRFNKGMQHMNGERAIEYARARETIDNISEGSDFARSRRQRLIMEAFKTRLTQPGGLIHLPQLLAVANSHIDTNYALPSAAQLSQFVLDWNNVRFYQTALTNQNYLSEASGPAGTYILVPDEANYSWGQVRAFARRLWQDPALGVAMASTEIVVENDTGVPGAGGRLGTALARLGYRVGTPTTGTAKVSSRVVDGTGGDGQVIVRQLQAGLKVQLPEAQAGEAVATGKITLQLGSDDVGLADLTVPVDTAAPLSGTGVMRAGGWSPEAAAPEPTERPTPRTPVATIHTPTPHATVLSGGVPPSGSVELPRVLSQHTPAPTADASGSAAAEHSSTPTPVRSATPTPLTRVHPATPTPTVGSRQYP